MYREQTTGTKQTNSSTVFHSERFRQYLPCLGLKASPNPAVVVVVEEAELFTVDFGSSFFLSSFVGEAVSEKFFSIKRKRQNMRRLEIMLNQLELLTPVS